MRAGKRILDLWVARPDRPVQSVPAARVRDRVGHAIGDVCRWIRKALIIQTIKRLTVFIGMRLRGPRVLSTPPELTGFSTSGAIASPEVSATAGKILRLWLRLTIR